MSAPESAKTTVALIPSKKQPFAFLFNRTRELARDRQKGAVNSTVVYTTFGNYVSSGSGIVSNIILSPPTTPITQPKILGVNVKTLLVGTAVTPITQTQRNTRRVTILASAANKGTIWIVGGPSGLTGFGFPLAAGAAKDLGAPTMTDMTLNLTNVYVTGTDVSDTIYISEEYI